MKKTNFILGLQVSTLLAFDNFLKGKIMQFNLKG
jgi:hypothetical protein